MCRSSSKILSWRDVMRCVLGRNVIGKDAPRARSLRIDEAEDAKAESAASLTNAMLFVMERSIVAMVMPGNLLTPLSLPLTAPLEEDKHSIMHITKRRYCPLFGFLLNIFKRECSRRSQ
eukprot:104867_1